MGIVPEELRQPPEGGKFIKASEFEGEGMVLEVKGFETMVSKNPTYGAIESDPLFEQGKLQKGECFCYTFMARDADGLDVERVVESKSIALFIAFSDTNPDLGQRVRISKTGAGTSTRYKVELVETAENAETPTE